MQLELHQVSVSVSHNNILRDVVAIFGPGLHAITGRNGSGKSTLLKALAGVLPFQGSIRYDGQDMTGLSPRRRARIFGYLPQRISTTIPLTVADFLILGRLPHLGFAQHASAEDHAWVARAMETWELGAFAQRRMDRLSGGELQRVQLCRLSVQACPVWLLDEPGTFLDYEQKARLYAYLQARAQDHIILCVSHDHAELLPLATRRWDVADGRMIQH